MWDFGVSVLPYRPPGGLGWLWGILDWKRVALNCFYTEKRSSQISHFNTSTSHTIPLKLHQEQGDFSAQTSERQQKAPAAFFWGVSGSCWFWGVSESWNLLRGAASSAWQSFPCQACITSCLCFAPERLKMTFAVHSTGLPGVWETWEQWIYGSCNGWRFKSSKICQEKD